MGQTTANIGIYIPTAGETGYNQSFASGMQNVDLHDHSGGPNKGVPIPSSGIADGSITYLKLNADVVDTNTGLGISSTSPNQIQAVGILNNLYQASIAPVTGFIAMNGSTVEARTFTDSSTISWLYGDGSGNPIASVIVGGLPAFLTSVSGKPNQIAVGPYTSGNQQISLSPIVINRTQPAFVYTASAQNNVTGDGTNYQVLFATKKFDQGNNVSSSVFTAPVIDANPHIYYIGFSLYISTNTDFSSSSYIEVDIYINGSLAFSPIYFNPEGATVSATINVTASQIMSLNSGDTVYINIISSAPAFLSKAVSIVSGNFNGYLIT